MVIFTFEEILRAQVTMLFVRVIDASRFVEKEDFVVALARCQSSADWKKNPAAVFEALALAKATAAQEGAAAAQKKVLCSAWPSPTPAMFTCEL